MLVSVRVEFRSLFLGDYEGYQVLILDYSETLIQFRIPTLTVKISVSCLAFIQF